MSFHSTGDIVVLTVKHFKAATPFLQKQCKINILLFLYIANTSSFLIAYIFQQYLLPTSFN